MSDLPDIDLPLYDFFQALRKNGFTLGLEEYYDLLQALQVGQGIDLIQHQIDRKQLLSVCKTLWLKPHQSRQVFENLYQSTLVDFMQADTFESTPKAGTDVPDFQTQVNKETPNTTKDELSGEPEETNTLEEANPEEERPIPETDSVMDDSVEPITKRLKFVIRDAPVTETEGVVDDVVKNKPRKFLRDPYVFNVSPRQMQQACKFLPVKQAFSDGQTLDLNQIVGQYARHGFFTGPVFKTYAQNRNQALLLIDQGGSMVGFKTLTNTFAQALTKAFKEVKQTQEAAVRKYYFYNTPHGQVYQDRAHTKAVDLTELSFQIKQMPHTLVFIVSDAGAARGGNNDGRFRATLDFLSSLKKATHKIAWLNPMPKDRWDFTTAERIARLIPMYALDDKRHLKEAIHHLKKY